MTKCRCSCRCSNPFLQTPFFLPIKQNQKPYHRYGYPQGCLHIIQQKTFGTAKQLQKQRIFFGTNKPQKTHGHLLKDAAAHKFPAVMCSEKSIPVRRVLVSEFRLGSLSSGPAFNTCFVLSIVLPFPVYSDWILFMYFWPDTNMGIETPLAGNDLHRD